MVKENKRITKTKQALKDCLFKLLDTMSLDEINVKDLCEAAHVNRSTFYNHYADIDDFVEEIEIYVANHVIDVLSNIHYVGDYEEQATDAFCDLLVKERDISKWLLDSRITGKGRQMVSDHCKNKFFKIWKAQGISDFECEYYFTFAFEGCIGFLKKWYDNDFKDDPEEMKKLFYILVRGTLDVIHR